MFEELNEHTGVNVSIEFSAIDKIVIAINFSVQFELNRLIDSEYRATHTKDDSFTFDSYHDLASINIWLDEQLELHSNVLTGITVGYSFEGRTIRAVRLSHKAVSVKRKV